MDRPAPLRPHAHAASATADADGSEPAKDGRSALFALVGTFAVQIMVSLAVVSVPVIAPAAAIGISLSANLVGIFVAIVYTSGMATSLFSGAFVQRFGPIRVSQACLACCACGLMCVASGAPVMIVAGAVLLGFGYGPVTPASSHLLAKTTPESMMGFVFSVKQTGVPLGGALAGAIVPTLSIAVGWQVAAITVGVVCLLAALVTQPIRAQFDCDRNAAARITASGLIGPLRMAFRNRLLRLLIVSSFFFGALQLCLVTYLVTYLVGSGVSLVRAGLMLTAAQAAGVLSRPVFGVLADRSGRPAVVLGGVAVGMGLATCAAVSLGAHAPIGWVTVVCAAFGATAIGWNGVYLAQVARLAPTGSVGVVTGAALSVTYAGVLVGPSAFALMTESGICYTTAFVVIGVPATCCGMALLFREFRR